MQKTPFSINSMKLLVLLSVLFHANLVEGQGRKTIGLSFKGTFIIQMSSKNNTENYPLKSHIDQSMPSRIDVFEIMDDQYNKGILKRVLINYGDSSWTTAIGFNDIKQGTRSHEKIMFRDSSNSTLNKFKIIKNNTISNGMKCNQYTFENDSSIIFLWVTDLYDFDSTIPITMLMHSGIISKEFKNKIWMHAHFKKGMIVKISTRNKFNQEEQVIELKEIHPGAIDPKLYDLKGYRIADIPEGQNCGVLEKE